MGAIEAGDDLLSALNVAAVNYRLYGDVCYATRLLHAAEALLDEVYRNPSPESEAPEKTLWEWELIGELLSQLMNTPLDASVFYGGNPNPYTLDSIYKPIGERR